MKELLYLILLNNYVYLINSALMRNIVKKFSGYNKIYRHIHTYAYIHIYTLLLIIIKELNEKFIYLTKTFSFLTD